MKVSTRWFRKSLFIFVLGSLLLGASTARADVLLLIHGFQGNIASWDKSGVLPLLNRFGWKPSAFLIGAPQGLLQMRIADNTDNKKVVALQLNSELRLSSQASMVTAAIHWIVDHYPKQKIFIVGHSLGGVVARMALVQHGAPQVAALITIASPHLGTRRAYQGLDAVDDPFPLDRIKEFFVGPEYDTLKRSRGMLLDIVPAIPGKLLYWLNHQPHPPIRYYSIVRATPYGALGDAIVSGYSQDMSNVPAIGQRSKRVIQGFTHFLNIQDGYALLNILEQG